MSTILKLVLAIVVTLMFVAQTAEADQCVPDYANWGWLSPTDSMDNDMAQLWCAGDPNVAANYTHFWNSLHLGVNGAYWDNLALHDGALQCSPNSYVIRLMNAAFLMDQISYHAANTTRPNFIHWWLGNFVYPKHEEGYVATCEFGANATNRYKAPTQLHYKFFGWLGVVERSSTLVHETVHEWQGHVWDWLCPANMSCDTAYGDDNAQTWQIGYLANAVGTYRKDPDTNELLVRRFPSGTCGYIPYLSKFERLRAAESMQRKLTSNFIVPTPTIYHPVESYIWPPNSFWNYDGVFFAVDFFAGARWLCEEVCNPDDFVAPSGSKACDEEIRAANAGVNARNRQSCLDAIADLDAGVPLPQASYGQMAEEFDRSLAACVPGVDDTYLESYCADAKAAAQTLPALKESWDLATQSGAFDSYAAFLECGQEFCAEIIEEAWLNDARLACYEWSDPAGCLDELCGRLDYWATHGGTSSRKYFDVVQCNREFVESFADPAAYLPPENQGNCAHNYDRCVNDVLYEDWRAAKGRGECSLVTNGIPITTGQHHWEAVGAIEEMGFEQWQNEYTDATLADCEMYLTMCRMNERVSLLIAGKLLTEGYVPPPIEEMFNAPRPPLIEGRLPKFHRGLQELARVIASDSTPRAEGDRALEHLARSPEAQIALAELLGRDTYFAIFGTKDKDAVFGPDLVAQYAEVEARFNPDATAAQQAAIRDLESAGLVRARAESPGTRALFEAAVDTMSQADLFEFLHDVANASTPEDIAQKLDALESAAGR